MPTFLAALKDAGAADVVRVDAYQTDLGHQAAAEELLVQLLRTPPEDLAIVFSSVAEVRANLQNMMHRRCCMQLRAGQSISHPAPLSY